MYLNSKCLNKTIKNYSMLVVKQYALNKNHFTENVGDKCYIHLWSMKLALKISE